MTAPLLELPACSGFRTNAAIIRYKCGEIGARLARLRRLHACHCFLEGSRELRNTQRYTQHNHTTEQANIFRTFGLFRLFSTIVPLIPSLFVRPLHTEQTETHYRASRLCCSLARSASILHPPQASLPSCFHRQVVGLTQSHHPEEEEKTTDCWFRGRTVGEGSKFRDGFIRERRCNATTAVAVAGGANVDERERVQARGRRGWTACMQATPASRAL